MPCISFTFTNKTNASHTINFASSTINKVIGGASRISNDVTVSASGSVHILMVKKILPMINICTPFITLNAGYIFDLCQKVSVEGIGIIKYTIKNGVKNLNYL